LHSLSFPYSDNRSTALFTKLFIVKKGRKIKMIAPDDEFNTLNLNENGFQIDGKH